MNQFLTVSSIVKRKFCHKLKILYSSPLVFTPVVHGDSLFVCYTQAPSIWSFCDV